MAETDGTFDEQFAGVRDALAHTLDSGLDVGASVAVVVDDQLVVDVWGGWADEAKTVPWARDTITNVWSSTKTMCNLCALILADRGELDLHGPVARYWPEFAQSGKSRVEVRHLLGHTAGLSAWAEPVKAEDLYDWDRMCDLLAAQEPWWEPGTASGYHALTQGFLVGEVVRRITGQSLGSFFAKEVAGPLGADFHIGLPPGNDARVANVIPPPPLAVEGLDPDSVAARTLSNPALDAAVAWTDGWRRAEIPAANGHGNARSVVAVQSAVAQGGEARGVRLLSEKGCAAIFEEQARGTDLVLGIPLRIGMGYGINGGELPLGPNPRTCFWGGWGGSVVVVDLDARMTVAYMMNRMGEGTVGDVRGYSIVMAAYAALASRA